MRVHFPILFFALALLSAPARGENPVRVLLQDNRVEEAAAICRQFDSVPSNETDNNFACAWAYFRTNRADSAEKILARNRKSFTSPEFQLLTAFGRVKKKQFEEARQILNIVQTEQKGNSFGLWAQELNAEVYELKGQLDTAAFIYKQVVGDDPTRARAHWGLGRYYLSRGDTGRARTHLEAAARLWPKHLGSRYNLAVLNLNQDSLGDAAKWLAECYKLNKGDPGVLEQLGLLFEKKGMIPEAIRHWQRAVDIKKDATLAKEKLATYTTNVIDTLVDKKQYGDALAELEKMKSFKDDPKMLLRRAIIQRNLGRNEKAIADLVVYLNANPRDGQALRELGNCYVNVNKMEQAENYFMRAIAEEPGNGLNYAWIAFALESRGEFAQALEAWKRAIELFKDPAEMEKAQRKVASLEKRLNKKKAPKGEEEN